MKKKFTFEGRFPTGAELNMAMLNLAHEVSKKTGMSISEISRKATGNISFLTKVRNGDNWSRDMYDRFIAGIEKIGKSKT